MRRFLPAMVTFGILLSVLLDAAKRLLPTNGVLQSPAVVLLITVAFLCPLILLSARQLITLAVNLEMAHLEVLGVLSKAIAKRDDATEEHNIRVAIMAVHLASATGLDQRLIPVPGLFIGALLHDVGKIGVPDSILLKPGKLSPEEQRKMEQHVAHGDEILSNSILPHGASQVVHYHHEHFDGSGYPEGKRGAEIPPQAWLFAIVDTFDALTSDRPYKQPVDLEETLRTMECERGTHFDPVYLDAFKTIVRAMYSNVTCVAPKNLKEIALELGTVNTKLSAFQDEACIFWA
jgi:HD-GYP domain-containing protein (c-di-GMP phosphodiesterase class II)